MDTKTGRYIFDAQTKSWVKVDSSASVHRDAYFRSPYFEPAFADDKNPEGRWVNSKREKWEIMRQQGIVESGDKIHGARSTRIR